MNTTCIECVKNLGGSQYLAQIKSMCDDCYHWYQFSLLKEDPNSVRVKGKHYFIGPEDDTVPKSWRGFNGSEYIIRFNDGREVKTTNLDYCGEIPHYWKARLPDNAEFLNNKVAA